MFFFSPVLAFQFFLLSPSFLPLWARADPGEGLLNHLGVECSPPYLLITCHCIVKLLCLFPALISICSLASKSPADSPPPSFVSTSCHVTSSLRIWPNPLSQRPHLLSPCNPSSKLTHMVCVIALPLFLAPMSVLRLWQYLTIWLRHHLTGRFPSPQPSSGGDVYLVG